jgi:hypothetical protein
MRNALVLATPSLLMLWAATAAAEPGAPIAAAQAPTDAKPAPIPDPAAAPEPAADPTRPASEPPVEPTLTEPQPAHTAAAPPPPEPLVPKILLTPQHDRPTGPRTFHNHDGFYLRTNFGLGLLWGGFTAAEPADQSLDANGSGIALDLLIGGSPSPGLAIGGGLIGNWLFGAEFEDEDGGTRTDHDVTSGLIGVFIDGFPQPTAGWHLGGLVGLGGHTLTHDGIADQTGGFGGAIWGGYDQWVGDDFSVGGLLRFTAMRSTGEKDGSDVSASTASLGLTFSALYH